MAKGRGKLEVAPQFASLSESSKDVLTLLAGGFEPQRIGTLNGYTREGLCTLLYLSEEIGAGVVDYAEQMEIKADRWRISSAVMGLHLESVKHESIDSAAFYFNKVQHLLPNLWQTDTTADHLLYSAASIGKSLRVSQRLSRSTSDL